MKKIVIIFLLVMLSGCSYFKNKDEDKDKATAETLYTEARSALDSGAYSRAVELYQKLETTFPFGTYSKQAILDLAYAHYKNADPDEAIATTERFIKLYPQNNHVDYAYYLKGLVNFYRGKGFIENILAIDEAQRDPESSLQAFQDFSELLQRYPNSKYAEDAKLRMIYLRNILAQHEINVAQYYMRRGAFVAAANRARHVVEKYIRTPSIPDALCIMARAYKVMELNELFKDTMRILELNYPDDPRIDEIKQISLH